MKIRLLEFVTDFRIGGTERQVANLVAGLDRSRFELQVGCFRRLGEFLTEIVDRDIHLTDYPIRSLLDPAATAKQLRLARDLRRKGIQVVRSYGFYPNVFVLPAAWLAGVPVRIASIRDIGDHLTPLQRALQRCVCRLAHRVVVNAEAVRQRLVAEGYDPRRIVVIPNGIALEHFSRPADAGRIRAELRLSPEAPLVAVMARLNEVKGIEYFLAAAARIAVYNPEARFLVVGDSPARNGGQSNYRSALERQAALLGLEGRIVFTGFRDDVPALLSQVTVAVLPSISEGLSNVVLESMAAGVPVVATNVGGNPELVEDAVTGFLVPPRDADALADAICRLLRDRALAARLGAEGRKRAESRFSLEAMVHKTQALYENLLWSRSSAQQARSRRAVRGRRGVEGRA